MTLVDSCDECSSDRISTMFSRCRKCKILGCMHLRVNHECVPRTETCRQIEEALIKRAWVAELIAEGFCATPTGLIDCHGKRAKMIDGKLTCAFL